MMLSQYKNANNAEAYKQKQTQERHIQALLFLARDRENCNLHDEKDPRDIKALQATSKQNFIWLVEEKGADLNFSDNNRQLPIVAAMQNGNKYIFNLIIKHRFFNIEALDVPSKSRVLELALQHPDPYYKECLQKPLAKNNSACCLVS